MPTTTDAQLIRAARNDAGAFAELYRRHAHAVDRFLRARVPADVASELTAETFAQAALSLGRFRDEKDSSACPGSTESPATSRGHTTSGNESSQRPGSGSDCSRHRHELEEAEDRLDAQRLAPELADALEALPPAQRHALESASCDDLPYAQVALALGCTEVAARIRVTRALGSLSRRLKGTLR